MQRLLPVLLTLSLALSAANGFADEYRSTENEQRLEETMHRLDLSDEQIEQVTPIIEESARTVRSILLGYGFDPDNGTKPKKKPNYRELRAMRKEIDGVRAQTLAELEGILTDEQLAEYKAMQEDRRKEMRERVQERRD